MRSFKEMLYDMAAYIGVFPNIGSMSLKTLRILSGKSNFFRIILFLKEHKRDLSYVGGNKYKILSLDEVFSIKNYDLNALDLYFKERNRIIFFKEGGQIYAQVKNFIFALPFPHGIYELVETFYHECYGGIDIQNGNIIDIGAFIGDTAIYFASKGAKKIIAFEPAKNLFRLAVQNVQLNNLNGIVYLRNEAVGYDVGEKNFYYIKSHPGASSLLPRRKDFICYKVRVVPFSDVVAELDYIDLLKIDCEGMEEAILLQAHKDGLLKNISNIIVEVHTQEGLEKLKAIFEKASYRTVKWYSHKVPYLVFASKEHRSL